MAPGRTDADWRGDLPRANAEVAGHNRASIRARIADGIDVTSVSKLITTAKHLSFGLLVGLIFCLVPSLRAAEIKLDTLEVGGQTYSNVVVTSRNSQYVILQHARGMATLKPKDLTPEVLKELGYHVEPPPPSAATVLSQKVQKVHLELDPKVKEIEEKAVEEVKGKLRELDSTVIMAALGSLALFYFFLCYCCMLICKKAGHEPGILVWLPILQMFSLVKAAGMSAWWVFLMLVPVESVVAVVYSFPSANATGMPAWWLILMLVSVASVVAVVYWCVRICRARGKSSWLAVPLLLPVFNFFTFLYLAFADGLPESEPQRISLS